MISSLFTIYSLSFSWYCFINLFQLNYIFRYAHFHAKPQRTASRHATRNAALHLHPNQLLHQHPQNHHHHLTLVQHLVQLHAKLLVLHSAAIWTCDPKKLSLTLELNQNQNQNRSRLFPTCMHLRLGLKQVMHILTRRIKHHRTLSQATEHITRSHLVQRVAIVYAQRGVLRGAAQNLREDKIEDKLLTIMVKILGYYRTNDVTKCMTSLILWRHHSNIFKEGIDLTSWTPKNELATKTFLRKTAFRRIDWKRSR